MQWPHGLTPICGLLLWSFQGPLKVERHNAIRQLVTTRVVSNQDELRRLLLKRGHEVTQATLSRDLHALRLFKGPGGYQNASNPGANHDEELADSAHQRQ